MTKRLSRIAPWQAGKLFALVYFFTSLIFVIPLLLLSYFVPFPAGPGAKFSPGTLLAMPFLYAIIGLIFVPITAAIYNFSSKLAGGLQVTVTDDG